MVESSLPEESIFAQALEIDSAAERAAFLNRACGANAPLRAGVEALLRASQRSGDLLDLPENATPTVDLPSVDRPGTIIGSYKLLEQIGEGGFGVVFMAEQTHPVRRRVALKVLKPGMDTRQVVARFEAERQALAIMDHPNIAKVHDGGATPSGRPYFVMELVKGVPITEFCDRGHLTPRERLNLFNHVCQAVQHAHQKGIIHRDLKPSNILVVMHDTTPVVKVIDFGVAKALGQELTDKTLFTGFAQMIGTPLYMSPEQAGQSGLDVDTRSDIYSLGVLLYELMTGTTPFTKERFRGAGFEEIRRIIREEEPPRPSTRVSTLGQAASTVSTNRKSDVKHLSRLFRGELDWIVMKALEKDRNRRYDTANGLARDIERYLNDEPVQACPPSVAYRLRKFARRNRAVLTTLLLVAGALLSTVVVLVFSNISIRQKDKEKSEALVAKEAALADARREEKEKSEALIAKGSALSDANANRQKAESSLTLILAALDDVYITEAEKRFNVYRNEPNKREVTKDPRQLQLEREFMEKGLGFYEKLIQPGSAERVARFQSGKAYRRVGILQRELKQYDNAADSLTKAVSLLKKLAEEDSTEPQYRWELAESYRWQGHLCVSKSAYLEAERAYRRAIALADRLVAESPATMDFRVPAATFRVELGGALRAMEQTEKAQAEYLEAVERWQQLVAANPKDRWPRHELAYSFDCLGSLWQDAAHEPDNAESWFRKALKCHEELVAEDANDTDSRARLAKTLYYLGRVYLSTDRLPEAEKSSRMALEITEKLVADFPDRTEQLPALSARYNDLVGVLKKGGQTQAARDVYSRAAKFHEKLAIAHPQEPGFRDCMAGSRHDLAALLDELGQKKAAAEAFREAIAVWEKLTNSFPVKVEYRQHTANSYGDLAAVLKADGQTDEAVKCLQEKVKAVQEVIKLCEEFAAQVPENIENNERLQTTYRELGRTLTSWGRLEEAAESFSKAAAVVEKLVHDFPNEARLSESLYYAHAELATTFISAGRFREADEFYGKAIRRKPNNAMLWLRRAEFYGRLGLWDLAAKDSATAFKLQPPATPHLCISHAVLSVHVGDLNSYRQLCTLMQTRFHQETGYAGWEYEQSRAITTAAPPDANLAWAVRQAETGVQRQHRVWNYWALGRAHFRAGAYEQSVSQLKRSLELDANWNGGGLTYPVLAMAYQHLGQGKNAKEALEKASQVIDHGWDVLARSRAGTLTMVWWQDWLESCLLYREAKTLIDGSPPADDPRWFVARAVAFLSLGNQKEANESYATAVQLGEKLVTVNPDEPGPRDGLARGHFNFAGLLRERRQEKEAAKAFRQAIAIWEKLAHDFDTKPEYRRHVAYSYQMLAQVLTNDGQPEEAGQAYHKAIDHRSKAIELDGNDPADWRNRAHAYRALKQYDKALADYSKAIVLSPKDWGVWTDRGFLFFANLRQYDKAIADFSQAIEADPKNPNTWKARGLVYNNLPVPQYGKALADCSKAIELNSTFAGGWLERSTAYAGLGQFDNALADSTKAIELEPNNSWAWASRARTFCTLHQHDKAIADSTKAIELDPKNHWAFNTRGLTYRDFRQYDKAVADFTKAFKANPKYVAALNNRALTYNMLQQHDKAVADFSEAIKLEPENAWAWTNRAIAYQFLRQYDKAIADLSKVAELADKSADAANNLAWLLATCSDAKLRDAGKAVDFAKKAVALAPNTGTFWNTLGAAHYRAGDSKAAIAALEKSTEIRKGGDSFDWFFLAMAHWKLGETEKARKRFDEAVRWMDKNQPADEELRRFRDEAAELLGVDQKK